MRRGTCDIETDGLIEKGKFPTTIHTIVFKDYDTKEVFTFNTEKEVYEDFPKFVKEVGHWIGHNFLGYDMFVLNKLLLEDNPIKWTQVTDTLVLSRFFNPVVDCTGVDKKTGELYKFKGFKRKQHGLDAWAPIVGVEKIANDEWSERTETILQRCINDVEMNEKVYAYLLEEGKAFSKESIQLEHSVTYLTTIQSIDGFPFDVVAAKELYKEVKGKADALRASIEKETPPVYKPSRVKKLRRVADGSIHGADVKFLQKTPYKRKLSEDEWLIFDRVDFNIDSPSQIVLHLNQVGWKPTEFTKAGQPKVCEENLETLSPTAPECYKKFKEYNMLKARQKSLEEWFDALGEGNRIHGSVITCGAKTHRMAHRNPNTANIAGGKSIYGKECRQLWTVEDKDKYSLLGADAAGIQLRMLAHYINDPEYTAGVLGDPHTMHQHILGLDKRATAKTWIYAWLFGAGAEKLGSILGGTAKDGRESDRLFQERVPGLKKLKEDMKLSGKRGFVPSLNGGRIPAESARCLPAYLQGGEQVLMKLARSLWQFKAWQLKYDYHVCADVHDEWQTQVNNNLTTGTKRVTVNHEDELAQYKEIDGRIWSKPKLITSLEDLEGAGKGAGEYEIVHNKLGELKVRALQEAGRRLNLNCPMDGEYELGLTWWDTH